MAFKLPARSVARCSGRNAFWIDHSRIQEADYEWLESVERLTLWNVKAPLNFLARLKKLWWLDVRGGSARDLSFAMGATGLRYLAVNQVRGLSDLSVLPELSALRYMDLYGLSRVQAFPSLVALSELRHATIGQMQRLGSLAGLLQAPRLRSLQLVRQVPVYEADVRGIIGHPEIKEFSWFAEDVPKRLWAHVVERVNLPPVPICHPEEWFRRVCA